MLDDDEFVAIISIVLLICIFVGLIIILVGITELPEKL